MKSVIGCCRQMSSTYLVLMCCCLIGAVFVSNCGLISKEYPVTDPQDDSMGDKPSSKYEWEDFLEKTPIAYLTPLPGPDETPLDGFYAKIDPSPPQAWLCRRCADYRPAGGIWRLNLDQGIMHIWYEVTGWRSLASYKLEGDRVLIFNDPYCPDVIGEYMWKKSNTDLQLQVVADDCSIGLRGQNLSKQGWTSCDLAEHDHTECREQLFVDGGLPTYPSEIIVVEHPGDSRFFDTPPDVFVYASGEGNASEERITLSYSDESIAYGLNRILWWNGKWMEITTDLPFTSFGVQFLGDPQIGWAQIYFDGVEVWQGNTAAIWAEKGRHGGFIEVLNNTPGSHTIRVESLGYDYRPVTVASFGFSYNHSVIVNPP